MLISGAGRVGFIHIPKTGGTAITRSVLAPMGLERVGHKHGTISDLHGDVDLRFIFSFVRNPYRRFASQYRFNRIKVNASGMFTVNYPRLADFIRKRHELWLAGQHPYPLCQAQFLDERVVVYRFEDFSNAVDDVCRRIGIKRPELPKGREANFYGAYDWRAELDREAVDRINDIAAEDFERFGYERMTWEKLQ